MSDPIDARVLRWMVREAAAEAPSSVVLLSDADGKSSVLEKSSALDSAEEALLARLDAPPSALGKALVDGLPFAADDGDDDVSRPPQSSDVLLRGSDEEGEDDTDVRLSRPSAIPAFARVDVPGAAPVFSFGHGGDADVESAASEAFHSTSLVHEPPRARDAKAPSRARRARWATVASLVAAAACVLFFAARGSRFFERIPGDGARNGEASIQAERWVNVNDVPLAPGLSSELGDVRDLNALHAGDVVEATQGAVSFGSKDRLTWTLAPGTRVLVRAGIEENSARHVLVLENGSIRADVLGTASRTASNADPVGADAMGLFVIEAGDTEVATATANGLASRTTFSVTRSSIGLVVDVEEGTTRVSSRFEPSNARLLSAPHRASASLDGAKDFKFLDPIRTALFDAPVTSPTSDRPTRATAPSRTDEEARSSEHNDGAKPATPSSDAATDRTPKDASSSEPAAEPAPLTEAGMVASLNACLSSAQAKRIEIRQGWFGLAIDPLDAHLGGGRRKHRAERRLQSSPSARLAGLRAQRAPQEGRRRSAHDHRSDQSRALKRAPGYFENALLRKRTTSKTQSHPTCRSSPSRRPTEAEVARCLPRAPCPG